MNLPLTTPMLPSMYIYDAKDVKLIKTTQLGVRSHQLAYSMGCLEMSSSSPQLFLFSLCSCFLILSHSQLPSFVLASSTEATTGNITDMQSLLAFKDGITTDPSGALNSWNHSIHFCQWFGVTCGHRHNQRVTKLDLYSLNLHGSIAPHIGNLSFLRELQLQNNSLGSIIPQEIGRLKRLQFMMLHINSFGGEIPVNISSCSNLVSLRLSGNNLQGVIPPEVGMLSRLEVLDLGRNLVIAGSIPASMGNLSSLRAFYASGNSISGIIPDHLGRSLSKLDFFGISFNKLVGEIPPSIWNISSMETFDVSFNQIGGRLPSELGGIIFPCLYWFSIYNNSFTGTIPVSISNASYLEDVDMGTNKLSGDVPRMEKLVHLRRLLINNNFLGTTSKAHDLNFLSSLTNASNLEILSFFNNSLGGELPSSIGNLSSISLKQLHFGSNEVSGVIPREAGNLVSLEILALRDNKLTGNIPSTIGNLNKLQVLGLGDNGLNGTIPPAFANLSILMDLYMNGNNLHGTIPSSLGKCTKLLQLLINSNNLQGNIPREIFSASSLHSLDLSGNSFNGNLPSEVGTLVNLVELDISINMLSGEIPNTLASCVQLQTLKMDTNNFSGILPLSLSSLRGLEYFNLSHNNFSGTVPKFLEVFPFLQSLDLSFNNFEGAILEQGVFKNTTALSVMGNIKLCGGIPELRLPRCNSKLPKKKSTVKLTIGLAFVVTGAILFFLFLYLSWSKKPKKLPSLHSPWNALLKLSYQNLYEATGGFSEEKLIGVGSFGSVYKGLLPQDQQVVAVKVLNLQHQGASRSFQAECEALRRIRHRNLLKVVTSCSSFDHQGNDFKAIVYEFMANGSLDGWLHSPESQDDTEADAKNLDLSQRLDIVTGVASAVEYLHHHCGEPIVHCDLKPSNILLDSDMSAHVGDFGLAKLIQEGTTIQSSENQSSTIGLRGTVGYVAPEYGMGNEVSTFGDVYSYGIIVLEMFTGKRPTDHHLFNGCLNLRDYAEIALLEKVETVVDPRLLLIGKNADTAINRNQMKECLLPLLRVGIACAQELPRDRMTINDAIIQLHGIKKALLKTGSVHVAGKATMEIGSHLP